MQCSSHMLQQTHVHTLLPPALASLFARRDDRVMSSNSSSFTATRHLASLLQLLTFPRCLRVVVTEQLSTERLGCWIEGGAQERKSLVLVLGSWFGFCPLRIVPYNSLILEDLIASSPVATSAFQGHRFRDGVTSVGSATSSAATCGPVTGKPWQQSCGKTKSLPKVKDDSEDPGGLRGDGPQVSAVALSYRVECRRLLWAHHCGAVAPLEAHTPLVPAGLG
ncbi:unnamed protein product [Pleuronectes platessa]|uniref:Uncharacterized protein n=1 Tax=Pleuronectes platessa TaxID=8262 RepID=A0A9N7US35_PLEPL|nr:unnamed protein product [Pleuronectes platessa]